MAQGELKTITILSADITGSMTLLEDLTPKRVGACWTRYCES